MVEITNPFASASIKEFRQLIKDNVEQNDKLEARFHSKNEKLVL